MNIICCAGRRGLLQPLAAQLFSHLLNVFKRTRTSRPYAQLSSGIGADYAVVLRQYLLPVPAYCAAASVNDLQGALRRIHYPMLRHTGTPSTEQESYMHWVAGCCGGKA